jgi:hypothetical protein
VLSSSGNYAEAIVQGARELMAAATITAGEIAEPIHGMTVPPRRSGTRFVIGMHHRPR